MRLTATRGQSPWTVEVVSPAKYSLWRIVLFSVVGSAGPRDHLSVARHLAGIGVGASFLDGLVRIDVTRATRSPAGWRVDFYSDAAL